MESSFLIVGLGNPGKKYEHTKHNIGFMVADCLAAKFKKSFIKYKDIYWETSFKFNECQIKVIKPATFMNLSGLAVASGVKQHEVALSNLLIVCDDINLNFGVIRIRAKGSDGGQKGLRSIITILGTEDFPRLRIGVGDHVEDATQYVLSPFREQDREHLPLIINQATDAVKSFIINGLELAMSRFNRNVLNN